jgi:hypothetical protein
MTVNSTPAIPAPVPSRPNQDSVKIATPDILIENQTKVIPVDTMSDMIFQEIGGHELISISRNDLVNGRNMSYQLIRNLEDISIEYNSQTILPIPGGSADYFNSFSIRFNDHIPTVRFNPETEQYFYIENPAYGPGSTGSTVYIEDESGDLIIDLTGIKDTHRIEVEIIEKATLEDDTIYIVGEN